jgi:pyridoxamine 5'-phosphate oxidase
MNFHELRLNYSKNELNENMVGKEPFAFFEKWMNEAIESQIPEPTAMTIATVSSDNKVHSRVVLLKEVNDKKFIFYTNYSSQKGKNLESNSSASLSFFWPELERQIRIEGNCSKTDRISSENYFHSRPRLSQIGALASRQSQILSSRESLEQEFERLELLYKDKTIPMPEDWGGYALTPSKIEFWQGRRSRLHDRIVFEKDLVNTWKIYRLSP